MLRPFLVFGALVLVGCGDKITAPEIMGFVARWDSSRIKLSEEGLAMTWAPVNGWENLPAPGAIPVRLDNQHVLYRAIVIELRMVRSRYDALGCAPNNHVTLVLWREAILDKGLDVIAAHIGAEAGIMEGSLQPTTYSWECGLSRGAGAGAYLNRHMGGIPNYARPALNGRFRTSRAGAPRPCAFIKNPEELVSFGASCAMQHFDVDLDALLGPDTDGRGIAGGASAVRVSHQSLPGVTFTIDCATTVWARGTCG